LYQDRLGTNIGKADKKARRFLYRISEYTFDVDFLDNHDTGTYESIPLYVQNGGGYSEIDGKKTHGGGFVRPLLI